MSRQVDDDDGNETLRTTSSIEAERQEKLRRRFGGMDLFADFLGFAVASFFTVLLFGIVGAIVGTVGVQMGAKVPKIGGAISGTTQSLGIGGLIGGLIALFLAYLIGGYAAGRMARFDGVKNGLGVVLWTIIVAIILGILGIIFGSKFDVGKALHLHINSSQLTGPGLLSLLVALIVMFVSAVLGGSMGERYHRKIDRAAGAMR